VNARAPLPATDASTHRVWLDAPERFSAARVQPLHHTFHLHPLMQMPALADLAERLMVTRQCRFLPSKITATSEFRHVDESPDGRSVRQVFDEMATPGSWVALYNVEKDPLYAGFIREVMATVKPMVEAQQGPVFLMTGFIFISAPPSVTPFHIDRENNFWLQIKGRKTMTVWDHTDRVVVPAKDVEDFIVRRTLDKVALQDSFIPRGHRFDTAPGDGVYFPATSPHMTRADTDWVTPDDGIVVSIGVTFYTEASRRDARVHQVNLLLRRLGLNPVDPGHSAWRDAIKAPLGRVIGLLRAHLLRQPMAAGSY
jgi:hypothetical protein